MPNQKSFLFCLTGLCLTLGNGMVSAQQRPPTPPPPPRPGTPPPVPAPTNPLLTNPVMPAPIPPKPAAPKTPRITAYTLFPFETVEPTVQMTPEQSQKIKPIYEKFNADIKAVRAAAKTPDENRALPEKTRAMQAEADKKIDDLLTPEQRKKATGLIYETMAMISVGISPPMLTEMKLTPDQRVAILKVVDAVQAKMKTIPKAEYRAQYHAIMQAERVNIAPLLTPAQKAIYDRYDSEGKPIGSRKTTETKPIAPMPAPPQTAPAPIEPTAPKPAAPAPEKKP